ncbi:Alpha/beta hydrolase fold-1 [Aspergillus ambiguus]|uniref:alpha/beta hydrolase n=1 Tax=Aspergillus ambiguus TaxID=176160 RepID=UPI003CCDA28B
MPPTVVLVPGAWHTAACYSRLEPFLNAHGYPTESVNHPSIGAEPPTKTLADDVASVRAVLSRLIDDEGKTVVLLGHSYGGVVVSNASDGFGVETRAQQGKQGGIAVVMYLAAFALQNGVSLFDALGGKWLPWMKFDADYSYSSEQRRIFYHDVPAALQEEAIAGLRHSSRAPFHGAVTHEPWRTMSCAYLFCDDDQGLPLAVQEKMAGLMEQTAPPANVRTVHLPASHSPFLSMPERTAETIVRVAGEVGGAQN